MINAVVNHFAAINAVEVVVDDIIANLDAQTVGKNAGLLRVQMSINDVASDQNTIETRSAGRNSCTTIVMNDVVADGTRAD